MKKMFMVLIFGFLMLYSIIKVDAFTYYECNKYKVTIGEFKKTISYWTWKSEYRDYDVLQCPSNVTYDTANYPEGGECYIKNGSKYDIYKITYEPETYYRPDNAETLGDYYCQNGKKNIYSCEGASSNQALCNLMRDECYFINNSCVNKESYNSEYGASPKTGIVTDPVVTTTSHHDPIDICETSGFLKAIQILKTLFKIVCVIIPIILIITITLDASKLISEPSDFKKVFPIIKNRLLAALIILFIPTIVKITMKVIPKDSNFDNFVKCVENATEENIQDLESREKNN